MEAARQGARDEGHAAGREEGELALALRRLERRIGSVGEAARGQVARLDGEGLALLVESLSELGGAADLDAWLRRMAGIRRG